MGKYNAILFDIDDTLIDFKKSEVLSLQQCHDSFFKEAVHFEKFVTDYNQINRSLWQLVENGKISPKVIGKERFKQIAECYKLPVDPKIPTYYEEQIIYHSTWVEGAVDLLNSLKKKNIKIGFVTNGVARIQRSKYEKLNFNNYSDILVISEEVGFSKPHPQIFLHTLSLVNTEITHTLMVGDSLTSDGEGARKLGMPFCWYNPHQAQGPLDWQPDFMISELTSVLKL